MARAAKILVKRGTQSQAETHTLDPFEPALAIDTGRLYIGNPGGIDKPHLVFDLPPEIATAYLETGYTISKSMPKKNNQPRLFQDNIILDGGRIL
jgi:hypothetical protein